MKVEKLMVKKVLTCRPEDDLGVPARAMWDGDCGCVPVIDSWSRVIGIVTDRDLCMAAYTQGRRLQDIRVQDVMSRKIATCRPGDELPKACEIMRKQRVRRLPVIDGEGHLLGLVSLNDLARAARSEAPRSRELPLEDVALVLAEVGEPRVRPDASCALEPMTRKLSAEALEIC